MTDSPAVEIPDDLTAFEDIFYSKAKPVEDVTPEPEVEEVPEDEVAEEVEETEDETDAPESEDDDEEADPEDEESEEDEKPQRRNRKTAKERIKELTAEREDALRQLAIEREVSKRLKEAEKPSPVEEKTEVKEAPTPDDLNDKGEPLYPLGEFDPGYVRALNRHILEQEMERATRIIEEKRVQQEAEAARAKQDLEWNTQLEAVEKELPDVRDKIAKLDQMFVGIDLQYGQYLVDTVRSLDNGAYILSYLSDHPQEAKQIVAAGYTGATLSLGRLDAQIGSRKAQKEKETATKVTKAPPPPKSTPRGSGGNFSVPADTDDLDAFADMFFTKKKR